MVRSAVTKLRRKLGVDARNSGYTLGERDTELLHAGAGANERPATLAATSAAVQRIGPVGIR